MRLLKCGRKEGGRKPSPHKFHCLNLEYLQSTPPSLGVLQILELRPDGSLIFNPFWPITPIWHILKLGEKTELFTRRVDVMGRQI